MRTTQHYTNPIGTKSTQLKETPFPPKRHAVHRAAGRKLAPVLLAKGDRQDGVVYWDTPLPPSRPAPPIACVLTHTWHLAFSQLQWHASACTRHLSPGTTPRPRRAVYRPAMERETARLPQRQALRFLVPLTRPQSGAVSRPNQAGLPNWSPFETGRNR